ncbi:MAG TPA: prefoldin subunit alpha [Candidatus Nanoarchaeia archaeon]|nr:prefoldin subunit alpha [Candidatus Nanoarchaeia archaeon]
MNNEEAQEKYVELQMLDAQIKELQSQAEAFESKTREVAQSLMALDELKEASLGSQLLAPISPGIFVKAELKDNSEFLMNVGSGIVVNKDLAGVKRLLTEQLVKVDRLKEQVADQVNKLAAKAIPLQQELNTFIETQKDV